MVHSLSKQRILRVVSDPKALYGLLGNTEDFNSLDIAVQCNLFSSMVVPILEYGADLWSTGEGSCEVLENGLWPSTKINAATMAVLGELGKFTLLQGIRRGWGIRQGWLEQRGYWKRLTSRCLHNCIGETQELGKESVERSGRDWAGETMHTRTKLLGSGLVGLWSWVLKANLVNHWAEV